jgi:hypothetical protein
MFRHGRMPPVTGAKGTNSHGRLGGSGVTLATSVSRVCGRVIVRVRTSWVWQVKWTRGQLATYASPDW